MLLCFHRAFAEAEHAPAEPVCDIDVDGSCGAGGGSRAPVEQPPDRIANIVAALQNSVMRIVVVHPPEKKDGDAQNKAQAGDDSQPVTRTGSGFVIDPSGLVATNRHVVENSLAIFVATPDGGRYRAELVGMPGKADMALLRIHPEANCRVRFGDSDKLRPATR